MYRARECSLHLCKRLALESRNLLSITRCRANDQTHIAQISKRNLLRTRGINRAVLRVNPQSRGIGKGCIRGNKTSINRHLNIGHTCLDAAHIGNRINSIAKLRCHKAQSDIRNLFTHILARHADRQTDRNRTVLNTRRTINLQINTITLRANRQRLGNSLTRCRVTSTTLAQRLNRKLNRTVKIRRCYNMKTLRCTKSGNVEQIRITGIVQLRRKLVHNNSLT